MDNEGTLVFSLPSGLLFWEATLRMTVASRRPSWHCVANGGGAAAYCQKLDATFLSFGEKCATTHRPSSLLSLMRGGTVSGRYLYMRVLTSGVLRRRTVVSTDGLVLPSDYSRIPLFITILSGGTSRSSHALLRSVIVLHRGCTNAMLAPDFWPGFYAIREDLAWIPAQAARC